MRLALRWMLPATLAMATVAFAADSKAAGVWKIDGDVQGYPIRETCTLAGTDAALTGTCVDDQKKSVAATATWADDTLTMKHPGEYQGQALTLTFAGTLVAADGSLTGSIDVQPLDYQGTFTAKRGEAAPAPAPAPAKP